MKLKVIVLLMLSTILLYISCDMNSSGGDDSDSTEDNNNSDLSAADKVSYSIEGVSFNMAYVPGGLSFFTGINDDDSSSVEKAYWIGETEVTYRLWESVVNWATSNGYSFANDGVSGDGDYFENSYSYSSSQPVTTISWRDSIVWCNALTEWYNTQNDANLSCVYTNSDSIVRDSTSGNASSCDNCDISATANGFRLLTKDEWELAARYIRDANGDGDIMDSGEYYPGDFASGADADYQSVATSDYNGDGNVLSTVDVADYWADNYQDDERSSDVKSKSANSLGVYDMSGNVSEWCSTRNISRRVTRGGNWMSTGSSQRVGGSSSTATSSTGAGQGFRFGRNVD